MDSPSTSPSSSQPRRRSTLKAAAVIMAMSCAASSSIILPGVSASPVGLGHPFLLRRSDDGLVRMDLVPSARNDKTQSMLAVASKNRGGLSTYFDVDEFVAANYKLVSASASTISAAAVTNTNTTSTSNSTAITSSSTTAADSVSQQLTVFKTVITEFHSPLNVGTPSQTLRVLFDTGSFNLWLRGKNCKSQACVNAPSFDGTASSTFKTSNQKARDLQYADGTIVSGIVATDVFAVGTAKVSDFQFTLAESIDSSNPEGEKDSDGIVGMSLAPQDSRLGAFPIFFNSLVASKAITIPQFSYYILPNDTNGQVIFGGYDKSLMANPSDSLTWVSVTDSTYFDSQNNLTFRAEGAWAVPITSITSSVSGISHTFTAQAGIIMDTGTSLGVVPSTLLRRLAGVMKARSDSQGNLIVSCDARTVTGGPVLYFNLGNNVTVALTAAEYVIPVPFQSATGQIVYLCVIALEDVSDSANYVLMGNTLLKRYLTVFDYATGNIGFALAKGRTPLPSNAPSITGAGSSNTLAKDHVPATAAPSKSSSGAASLRGSWRVEFWSLAVGAAVVAAVVGVVA
ncbi:hypothetical protein HDU96_003619 [Phlyctochytrium bullatum]|nr:hypothetical protein HDU96_003619 [Phlyctochytrium bullatum]